MTTGGRSGSARLKLRDQPPAEFSTQEVSGLTGAIQSLIGGVRPETGRDPPRFFRTETSRGTKRGWHLNERHAPQAWPGLAGWMKPRFFRKEAKELTGSHQRFCAPTAVRYYRRRRDVRGD